MGICNFHRKRNNILIFCEYSVVSRSKALTILLIHCNFDISQGNISQFCLNPKITGMSRSTERRTIMAHRTDFLYLSEPDTIAAGVLDTKKCIDNAEEVFTLLAKGDYLMGGNNHNNHGMYIVFPKESEFPNMHARTPQTRKRACPAAFSWSPLIIRTPANPSLT